MKMCMAFDVGTTNMGFAAAKVEDAGDAVIVRAEIINIKANSTDASILKLWTHLDAVMEDIPSSMKIAVYIEQQPSKAKSVMRSVELGVRHYFLQQGRSRRIDVKSVSSRSKLSNPVIYAAGATDSQKYRARKKASVAEIGDLLSEDAPDTWKSICAGKADDVCDALLYIVRHGKVTRFREHTTSDNELQPIEQNNVSDTVT